MSAARPASDDKPSIAIIGAGFSGLGMTIALKRAGIESFTVYEAAAEVGGTWRDNTYPGCACDIPSHLYSYSFERNPHWTRKYSGQPEIQSYLVHCADKYGVRPHIRFHCEITGAAFDEAAGIWRLSTKAGETIEARVVVNATGPLSRPSVPHIPGIERFRGRTFHSARWDHQYDLRGKRVAVIGTGASAIQFVPQIAPDVARLDLYQRTPPWVLPRLDRAFAPSTKALFAGVPGLTFFYRALNYWAHEVRAFGFVENPRILEILEWLGRRHIAGQIADPALQEKVTPDFRMGCKRILMANDYYPALTRENVEVITCGVESADEGAILAKDGARREVDAIIYGTGFDLLGALAPVRVTGAGGRELNEEWREGAEAYYGLLVSGFPNLFIMLGPNSGLGHNSMVFMIEAQIHYILQYLDTLQSRRLRFLDVLPRAQREFNDGLQSRMKRSVWNTGCRSWYLDERGRNFTLWPGFTCQYWRETRRVAWADYRAVAS